MVVWKSKVLIVFLFCYRNFFQNGINALSKMVFKNLVFVKKLKILCSLDNTILFKFHQHVVQNTYHLMYGKTLDFQCQH